MNMAEDARKKALEEFDKQFYRRKLHDLNEYVWTSYGYSMSDITRETIRTALQQKHVPDTNVGEIAEASDPLYLCRRKTHLPEHDGATGYFYYEPVEGAPSEISVRQKPVDDTQADLLPVDRTQSGGDVREALYQVIGEAIGEASMCWNPTPEGVFDSSRAKGIVEELTEKIHRAAQSTPATVTVEECIDHVCRRFTNKAYKTDATMAGARLFAAAIGRDYPHGLIIKSDGEK